MIYANNFSIEEKKAIEELNIRIINDLPKDLLPWLDDAFLLYRFLKARDFDVDKAERMLRRSILWRKHFQLETILEDFTPKPVIEKYAKISNLGLDKNGNMVIYFPLGNLDAAEFLKCLQFNDCIKHAMWIFEDQYALARKLNRQHPEKGVQLTTIINLDKLTLRNATSKNALEILLELMRMVMNNCPEVLNAAYLINTPGYFAFIWSILKPLMSNAFIKKIYIYGHSGWQEKLLEIIDADVLPAFLGGNRTDPDGNPLCNTFVVHGGKIPECYYLSEEERNFTNKSLVKKITILSKQKKEITIRVPEIASRIHWEFLIKNKDIGFGIFYKVSATEYDEILPIERYHTTDGVEKGSYKTRSSGDYIIVFDNSFSWMNSKEVHYCINVVKPES